jgi:hypothetical protein
MADRKKTPDILGSLLGDTIKPEYHNTGIPEYHNTSEPELQPTIKPVRKSTGKTVSKPTSKPEGQKKPEAQPAEKVKATFYLDAGIVEALEEGWMELRKLADKKDRGQISKSLIVELALQLALEDLEKRGAESSLARRGGG